MLQYERGGYVHSGVTLQALGCPTTCVYYELRRAPPEKPNTATVANTDEQGQIQGKGFGAGKHPAAPSVLIAELYLVSSALDNLAQLMTFNQHVDQALFGCPLSR